KLQSSMRLTRTTCPPPSSTATLSRNPLSRANANTASVIFEAASRFTSATAPSVPSRRQAPHGRRASIAGALVVEAWCTRVATHPLGRQSRKANRREVFEVWPDGLQPDRHALLRQAHGKGGGRLATQRGEPRIHQLVFVRMLNTVDVDEGDRSIHVWWPRQVD